MWSQSMLGRILSSIVRDRTLTVLRPGNAALIIGEGEPHIRVRLHNRHASWALCTNPDLALGELYMNGSLTIEQGDIASLLDLLVRNAAVSGVSAWHRLGRALRALTRSFAQFNPMSRARAHVAHHYDLSRNLYEVFLDEDMQYSCAYYSDPSQSLEKSQIAKKRHIAAKLNLDRSDLSVLDIGCGWGGLALDLARDCEANVYGVTLSKEQLAVAKERAARAALSGRAQFDLIDYREINASFDRIVSVGMFEHVGVPYYDAFFRKIRRLLKDDGVMLLHSIGRTDGPGATNPWITKYIFPGGYVPALSEVLPVIERNGLIVTDIEVLRLHYAYTLQEWRRRFQERRAQIAQLYDERFCRMWEFYLAGSEMAFRYEGQVVYQIQLAKRIATLPLTRDYMIDRERTMKFSETSEMPSKRQAA